MAVHAAIALGLDFSPGKALALHVWRTLRSHVHPSRESGNFIMVVSFGRSSFRLDEDNVSLALEAATGGFCDDLKVSLIRDRVFSFSVSSKVVGLLLLRRKFYSCPQFKCYYHLWSFGGPNWWREFLLWERECAGEWILASRARRRAWPLLRQRSRPRVPLHINRALVIANSENHETLAAQPLASPCSSPVVAAPPEAGTPVVSFGKFAPVPLIMPAVLGSAPLDHAPAAPARFSNSSLAGALPSSGPSSGPSASLPPTSDPVAA
jgi:hypothetical protein